MLIIQTGGFEPNPYMKTIQRSRLDIHSIQDKKMTLFSSLHFMIHIGRISDQQHDLLQINRRELTLDHRQSRLHEKTE